MRRMWRLGQSCGCARVGRNGTAAFGRLLCSSATEAEAEGERKGRGSERWLRPEVRREFLDSFAREHGIETPEDWRKVSSQQVRKRGGNCLLAASGGLYQALRQTYGSGADTAHWEEFVCRRQVSNGYWAREEHRRRFVRYVEEKEAVRRPEDWKRVTWRQVVRHGGSSLINRYGSVAAFLQSVEGGEELSRHRPRLPKGTHNNDEQLRQILLRVEEAYSIQKASDWRRVRRCDVMRLGGGVLLARFGSLFATVSYLRPEWDVLEVDCNRRVSAEFWDCKKNARKFLERLAREHNVEKESDWRFVTSRLLYDTGGTGLLIKYGSLWSALLDLFPEKEWQVAECTVKAPKHYWRKQEHVAAFLDRVKERAGVRCKEDWKRVSRDQLAALGGRFLSKLSIVDLLRTAYPTETWEDGVYDANVKRATQRVLYNHVHDLIVATSPHSSASM